MAVIKLDFDKNHKVAESQIQRINSLLEKEDELMQVLNEIAIEIHKATLDYDETFKKLVRQKGFENLERRLYEYTSLIAVSLDENNDLVYTYTGDNNE